MSADGFIALAAGGTGGHLFPAEALAQEMRRRGWRILLVTDDRGARFAADFPADDRFQISAKSPSVGGPVAKAAAAISLAGGVVTALREFRRRDVAAAVGFGGYPSFPAMKAAAMLSIPFGVHEQNAVLGRANRLAAPGASFLAHAFPILERTPEKLRPLMVEIGNPVRDAVLAAARPFAGPQAGGAIRLLVFGGSQGATLFSKIVPAAVAALPEELRRRIAVTQQARDEDRDGVAGVYEAAGVAAEIAPFFRDLPQRMAHAHLVIARAGASSVTELSIIGRPSILVPLAIAMDDHQTGNARALADGALIIAEGEFTSSRLAVALREILGENDRLTAMANRASGRVRLGAAAALADLVESVARRARKAA
jgi:UDP-N-acetylglucosamine--N-acetylmuramyl-(pentapeptide) pyrophosphoryl-undecaprenol N-acetylglucosamine transferase